MEELKKLLKWVKFSFYATRSQNFYISEKYEIGRYLLSNLSIFLNHWLFGITHLESMFHLRRNQVCLSKNWQRSQRQVIKDAGPFPKIPYFRCFSYIFAIAKQLPGFSINRLASVEDFFNVFIFFKCKYMCKHKRLFI